MDDRTAQYGGIVRHWKVLWIDVFLYFYRHIGPTLPYQTGNAVLNIHSYNSTEWKICIKRLVQSEINQTFSKVSTEWTATEPGGKYNTQIRTDKAPTGTFAMSCHGIAWCLFGVVSKSHKTSALSCSSGMVVQDFHNFCHHFVFSQR